MPKQRIATNRKMNVMGKKPNAKNLYQSEADKLFRLGNELHQKGQIEQAINLYSQILHIQPDHFDALHLSGVAAIQINKPKIAVDLIKSAIQIRTSFAPAYYHLALACQKLEYFNQALDYYDQAINLQPSYSEAHCNKGAIYDKLGLFVNAVDCFNQAVLYDPKNVQAYSNRGKALKELKQYEESLASCLSAISLDPKLAEAYSNAGIAFNELHCLAKAENYYRKALIINFQYADAQYNLGNVLTQLKRTDEAIKCFDYAIEIQHDYSKAYWNKSLALLLAGDMKLGWQLFEWRWKNEYTGMKPRSFVAEIWLGQEELQGKAILLHAEQGLGDTIQFCRYAKLVKALGAHVILEVPQALIGLLSQLEGVDELIPAGSTLPNFDYHCPLMSLPLAFNTELDSIPSSTKYISADLNTSKVWRNKLGSTEKLKVGVVWNGGFRANQPELWSVNERRNIQLSIFSSYLKDVDVDFYSLQKGDPAESEIKGRELDFWPNGNFYNFMDEVNDFTDTAALIDNLDLVIAVDTSTAHLAAAMGKPTWILNRFDTCWRWLLDRNDSPWYESVKLYRQDESRDWAAVMMQVVQDLKSMC